MQEEKLPGAAHGNVGHETGEFHFSKFALPWSGTFTCLVAFRCGRRFPVLASVRHHQDVKDLFARRVADLDDNSFLIVFDLFRHLPN